LPNEEPTQDAIACEVDPVEELPSEEVV